MNEHKSRYVVLFHSVPSVGRIMKPKSHLILFSTWYSVFEDSRERIVARLILCFVHPFVCEGHMTDLLRFQFLNSFCWCVFFIQNRNYFLFLFFIFLKQWNQELGRRMRDKENKIRKMFSQNKSICNQNNGNGHHNKIWLFGHKA